MQINEKRSNITLVLSGVIAVLLLLFWFKGCDMNNQKVIVKLPEVKGSFEAAKPFHDTIFLTKNGKTRIVKSTSDEFLQSEIDRLLKEYNSLNDAFAKANDSLQQELYSKTIAAKYFSQKFDNDTLSATVKGVVANGEVQKIKLDYTIKARSVNVKVPEVKFRLLGGLEAGMTKSFDAFNSKVNLGLQNRTGSIFTVSADSDERFYIGYHIALFSFKK